MRLLRVPHTNTCITHTQHTYALSVVLPFLSLVSTVSLLRNRGLDFITKWSKVLIVIKECKDKVRGVRATEEEIYTENKRAEQNTGGRQATRHSPLAEMRPE